MKIILIVAVLLFPLTARAETPEKWIALGARVHGAFGAFIPVGIRIGLDAVNRLNAKPRELMVLYYDSDKSPCACFADGIAIATNASVGQRTLTISPEKAPEGAIAVADIRPRKGGPGFKYTIPISALAKLGPMNQDLDPHGRHDAVMAADGLFAVEPIQSACDPKWDIQQKWFLVRTHQWLVDRADQSNEPIGAAASRLPT